MPCQVTPGTHGGSCGAAQVRNACASCGARREGTTGQPPVQRHVDIRTPRYCSREAVEADTMRRVQSFACAA
jgi:hypothetical protein